MGFEGLSSGVVIALAAVLWLVYLIPTWLRRREYLATERNAVRLQQTLRIMAETAELPDQVRAETTARSVAVQEKFLQREMQRTEAIARAQDAAAARAAARKLAESQPAIAASVAHSSQASRRLRRSRLVATAVLLAALAGLGFGIGQVVAGQPPILLASGGVVALGAVALLTQIAQVGRTRIQLAETLQPKYRAEVFDAHIAAAPAAPVRTSWTPVPVPKPLYLSRSENVAAAVSASSELQHAAALRLAAAEAERALRSAQQKSTPAPLVAAQAASSNRFARMGIIEVDEATGPNLDDVLARRRAV